METRAILFALIRAAVFGEAPAAELSALSAGEWDSVCKLGSKHNLAHLVAEAALGNNLVSDPAVKAMLSRRAVTAMQRYYSLENELSNLKSALEGCGIDYIPLKGSVIRALYPKPWLRTSCDIDLLLHERDLKRATNLLKRDYGYKFLPKSSHDIGGESPSGVYVELHYTLIPKGMVSRADEPLADVWSSAEQVDGTHEYRMSDPLFYYYHIAHMAKHVRYGGCGIRSLIDMKLMLNSGITADREVIAELLSSGGLEKLSAAMEKLASIWFEGGEYDDLSRRLEDYIFSGGAYGTKKNISVIGKVKTGRRSRFIASRIWMPYNDLKNRYPSLQKCRLLLPLYELWRWVELIVGKRIKNGIRELSLNAAVTDEECSDMTKMMAEIGIFPAEDD